VVVTATDWANFYSLRDHEAAAPEIQALAIAMREAMDASNPDVLPFHEWHLPYVTNDEVTHYNSYDCCLLSTARCARVSYAPFDNDGKVDIEADLRLADRLIGSSPLHASPAEHQATPDHFLYNGSTRKDEWEMPHLHGNFFGWKQFRKTLPAEYTQELGRSAIELNANYKEYTDGQNSILYK
jgi:hypothetical protein